MGAAPVQLCERHFFAAVYALQRIIGVRQTAMLVRQTDRQSDSQTVECLVWTGKLALKNYTFS